MLRVAVLGVLAAAMATSAVPAENRERHREVVRFLGGGGGQLGVSLEEVRPDDLGRLKLREEKGALVREVHEGSAAAKAGLKEDDVIVRYHGESVLSARQLARLVRETPSGRAVPVEVLRDGSAQTLTVTLEEGRGHRLLSGEDFHFELPAPPEAPEPPEPPLPPRMPFGDGDEIERAIRPLMRLGGAPRRLGIEYQELSGQLARYFKVEDGVLVTQVDEGSPAAQAGLQAGDVIVKFDGESIGDGGDLREAVDGAKEEATVTVQRDGRSLDVKVKVRPAPRRIRRSSDS
jgi:serine protease Do